MFSNFTRRFLQKQIYFMSLYIFFQPNSIYLKALTKCDLDVLSSSSQLILGPIFLLESSFFWKMNYFSMFGSVIKNKSENTFRYLVMP
jgi:hypothetical protein